MADYTAWTETWLYLSHYHSVDIHHIRSLSNFGLVAGRTDFGCSALLSRASTAFINDAGDTASSFAKTDRGRGEGALNRTDPGFSL